MSEEVNNSENTAPVQAPQEQPKSVLFGTIGYNDDASYENFIKNMNLGQALFVLIASANFSQAKGAFNLLESEVLSNAIRIIRKNSSPAEQATSEASTNA